MTDASSLVEPGSAAPISPRRQAIDSQRAERVGELSRALIEFQTRAEQLRRCTWEIGCGHGHFLDAYAAAHADEFCVGIDYCAERIRRAMRKQARARGDNLRFVRAEAHEFLDAAKRGAPRFHRVFILFPDPWPKRRHRKYRLMSHDYLTLLADFAHTGAELYFRTDSIDYFEEAAESLRSHARWQTAEDVAWPFEQETVFQKKAASFQQLIAISPGQTTSGRDQNKAVPLDAISPPIHTVS